MNSDDPVTLWIDDLRNADTAAATKLWNHFVNRLYESARTRLKPHSRAVYDQEDAALSAFNSVCSGIVAGRFPDLNDRDSMWRMMLAVTARKVAHRHRHDYQQRRDVRRNLDDYLFVESGDSAAPAGIDNIPSREPTPEFAAEFVDTCDVLFRSLADPQLQQVVTLRMDGYTDAEVAERLNCSRRTIQRRLEVIRRHLTRMELSSE